MKLISTILRDDIGFFVRQIFDMLYFLKFSSSFKLKCVFIQLDGANPRKFEWAYSVFSRGCCSLFSSFSLPPLSPPLSSPRAPFLSEVFQLFVFLALISSLTSLSHTHTSSLSLTHTLSLLLFFATLYSFFSSFIHRSNITVTNPERERERERERLLMPLHA